VALPLLESMVPAQTPLNRTAASPKSRLGCIYIPHGATMDHWTPATEGANFEFSEILDRKSTRLNSSHGSKSYAVFCLKKKNTKFSAYELSYSEGREREAYDGLRALYQRGEKQRLPRLLNQLRVMEERLQISANESLLH